MFRSRWVLRLTIAIGSVIALALTAGVWVVVANDFAMTEERVTIPGPTQPLQGALALPKDQDGPVGLVVFVHGDGPADADQDSFYRPLWESFARAGYASLSWDKPGINGAPGNWLDQTMHDRAVEAEAAIAWAAARGDIDPRRIGMWGISQAGWVVPEVAVRHPELQFVILAGPAINWLRQGEYNTNAELGHRNASDTEIAAARQRRTGVLELLRANATYEQYLAAGVDPAPMSADRWRFAGRNYLSDVSEWLPRLRIPVLLALGEQDLNVDVAETARVYRELVPTGLLTVDLYPNASHTIARADLDNDQGLRSVLVALFAPRSLYAPGYLDNLRNFAERQAPAIVRSSK
ncbi:alpha/beta hydrolase family protein [Nocardia crassostreae]|uniref:alpha/beta hydrolase family protein n=1 Tax=Nocardia crassostreae TaxID=53428 RepID=UPI000A64737E|nr:alpha/beta fold hydrolase [Nocardia crassostreae]